MSAVFVFHDNIRQAQQPVAATAPTRAPDQTNVYSEDELAKVTERPSDLGYLE